MTLLNFLHNGLDVLLSLVLLVGPGYAVISQFKISSWEEKICLTIASSSILVGLLMLLGSLIIPLTSIFWETMSALIALGLILFYRPLTIPVPKIELSSILRWEFVALVLLCIPVGIFPLFFEDAQYDTLSYHRPLIQSFSTQGMIPLVVSPSNDFERIEAYYPKLFEAWVGTIGSLAPEVAAFIPFLIFVGIVSVLYSLSKRLSLPSFPTILFFVAGAVSLGQSISFYVDGFLTFLLLVGILLMMRQTEKPSNSYFFLLGLIAAAIVLTKVSGIIWAIPLLLAAVFISRSKGIFAIVVSGVLVICYGLLTFSRIPFHFEMLTGVNGLSVQGYSFSLIMNRLAILIRAFLNVFSGGLWFPVTAIGLYAGPFFWSIKKYRPLIGIAFLSFLCWIPLLFFSNQNIRLDTFPRLLLPLTAIWSIFAVYTFKKLAEYWPIFNRVLTGLSVVAWAGTLLFLGSVLVLYSQSATFGQVLENALHVIPNNSSTTVFMANAPNGIYSLFDKGKVWDQFTFHRVSVNESPCQMLREKGGTHIVVFFPNAPRDDLGSFTITLLSEINNGNCGSLIKSTHDVISVYQI